ANVAPELDHSALHSETQSQERNPFRARITNRRDLAFDAALTKTARNQDAVIAAQQPLRAFRFNVLTADPPNSNLSPMCDSRVVERLVNRFVRVMVLGILADNCDADLVIR